MYNLSLPSPFTFLPKVLVQTNPFAVVGAMWERLTTPVPAQAEMAQEQDQELEILATEYRGTFVKSLKIILADLHLYQGEVDECFTPCLKQSLRRVQRYYGLPATGRLDQKTWQAVVLLTH